MSSPFGWQPVYRYCLIAPAKTESSHKERVLRISPRVEGLFEEPWPFQTKVQYEEGMPIVLVVYSIRTLSDIYPEPWDCTHRRSERISCRNRNPGLHFQSGLPMGPFLSGRTAKVANPTESLQVRVCPSTLLKAGKKFFSRYRDIGGGIICVPFSLSDPRGIAWLFSLHCL